MKFDSAFASDASEENGPAGFAREQNLESHKKNTNTKNGSHTDIAAAATQAEETEKEKIRSPPPALLSSPLHTLAQREIKRRVDAYETLRVRFCQPPSSNNRCSGPTQYY